MKRYAVLIGFLGAAWLLGGLSLPRFAVAQPENTPQHQSAVLTGTLTLPPVSGPPAQAAGPRELIGRLYFTSPAQLQTVINTLDVWEDHPEGRYLVVAVSPEQASALKEAGFRFAIDQQKTAAWNKPRTALPGQTEGIPGYLCYRTVEETFASAQDMVTLFPTLAQWIDIGDSWEKANPGGLPGYDMRVLKLTNQNKPGPKPKIFISGSIHAREYTPAELATRYAEYLLNNYGSDADITGLLDFYEVHLLLQANPDGRKLAEAGNSWRKNTNTSCPSNPSYRGIDLNRNFSFQWGCCGGSSDDGCDETYRGISAGSEPETIAMQNYIRAEFPDQRPPDITTAAPLTSTGIWLDLHSYGGDVMWPWGFTSSPAPNAAGLQTLGRKMAYFNNYSPHQSYTMYATDGTTKEFAYGEMGMAGYTIELGTDFFQDCTTFQNTILPNNLPVLFYASKAARRPYQLPQGPDSLSVSASPQGVAAGSIFTLTATANDTRFNNSNGTEPTQNIAAARYTIDAPSFTGVISYSMNAADGSFNSPIESLISTVNTTSWTAGRHTIFVESQDANGSWGPPTATFVWITAVPDSAITGVVRSSATGNPVNGAVVQLGGNGSAQTTTGLDGRYTFAVFSGTYALTATANAHYPAYVPAVVAVANVTSTVDITLTAIPTGTLHGTAREATTNFPLNASIVVSGVNGLYQTTSDPATGWYSLSVLSGTYSVQFAAAGHAPHAINNVTIPGNQATTLDAELAVQTCVLLVDDDGGRSYESYFTTGLNQVGVKYAQWNIASQNSPSAATLSAYPAVVWFTGDDAAPSTLSAADRTHLTAYLNSGGRLLLNGTEIGAGNWNQAFYTQTLASNYTADDSGVKALTGGGMFAGQTITLNGPDSANNQDFPDALSPRGSAQRVFTYTNGLGGGVAIDTGTYRAINLGFGLEGVQGAAQRAALLRSALTWLGCAPLAHAWNVSKSASAPIVWAGERLTYTVSISHTSALSATGVVITDRLPSGTSFAWASHGGSLSGAEVRWELGSITPTQQLQVQLAVQIDDVISGTLITNDQYGLLSDQTVALQTNSPQTVVAYNIPSWQVYLPLVLK
jgi:uncharacterized repeat protein (TIGR01451 family)